MARKIDEDLQKKKIIAREKLEERRKQKMAKRAREAEKKVEFQEVGNIMKKLLEEED